MPLSFRFRAPSKPATFALLMAVGVILSILPDAWTRWLRGFNQPLTAASSWLHRGAHRVANGDSGAASVDPAEFQRLKRDNDELRRLLAHQDVRFAALEQRHNEGVRIANLLHDSRAWLLAAQVARFDADRRKQTMVISVGSSDTPALRKDLWVAAGVPESQRPQDESRRQILFRQWLIGRITSVQPYFSTVTLTTDPQFRMPVLPARELADGTWQLAAEPGAVMVGRGTGELQIIEAPQDYFGDGYKLVLANPLGALAEQLTLPDRLAVGRIIGSRPVDDAPNHFNLQVAPLGDISTLTHVYVIMVDP